LALNAPEKRSPTASERLVLVLSAGPAVASSIFGMADRPSDFGLTVMIVAMCTTMFGVIFADQFRHSARRIGILLLTALALIAAGDILVPAFPSPTKATLLYGGASAYLLSVAFSGLKAA
jgi:predicted membrane channel-forming protein YqfA (hemolysin III family)